MRIMLINYSYFSFPDLCKSCRGKRNASLDLLKWDFDGLRFAPPILRNYETATSSYANHGASEYDEPEMERSETTQRAIMSVFVGWVKRSATHRSRKRRYLMLDGDHIINMNKYDPSKYNLTDKEKEGVWTA